MNRYYPMFPMLLFAGCASVEVPQVPEFHPASPNAVQSTRIEAFDVLAPVPATPPNLPVPPGPQRSPEDPEMNMKSGGEMGGNEGGMSSKSDGGAGAVVHEHEHAARAPQPPAPELHGPAPREGMMEGMPAGEPQPQYSQDHPPPRNTLYRERIDDEIKRGAAPMQKIKIPSEQRGMRADSPLYHEHAHHDSTHITHPDRRKDEPDVTGARIWACPMHPEKTLETPGGRCPVCDSVLAPVPKGAE